MLRSRTESGWWLVTHVEHARLAAAFAGRWGNDLFLPPEPRAHVLLGIAVHDDGWAARDAHPQITREGRPSAFSSELVGKYSAFEEIDLEDYLAVRERAVGLVAERDAYAALLVSMHTYDLLTTRADRSTIAKDKLPLLDAFLLRQRELQEKLRAAVVQDGEFRAEQVERRRIEDHFRLLQACDNLSLLSCVDYRKAATLLHPLPLADGSHAEVRVESLGERSFRLEPYPFDKSPLVFEFAARHVEGQFFSDVRELRERFAAAQPVTMRVSVTG